MAILVTRPAPYGERLTRLLQQHGLPVCYTPLCTFTPGSQLAELPYQLAQLRPDDVLIVVSQQAIFYAKQCGELTQSRWPANINYFAIGQSTARALQSLIPYPVTVPTPRENSEDLLQLPLLRHVAHKQVLLLQGNHSRPLIAQTLTARGGKVQQCQCYTRQFIDYPPTAITTDWLHQQVEIIIVTSAELLQRLHYLIVTANNSVLLTCQLIVISQRMARLAQALGWQKILIARDAHNDSLLLASQQLYNHEILL